MVRLPELFGGREYDLAVEPNSPEPRSGMNPDDVARANFSTVRKGYDQMEVKAFLVSVAAELRRAITEMLDLERDLRAARLDADRNREVDPARLTALLGEETARVLDAGRSAAEQMRANAIEEANQLLAEATEDADRMRREASEILAIKTAEADVEVAKVHHELDELRAQAAADAAVEVEAGRQRGREMVAEAQNVRERMLNDLGRRRKAFRQQIERLQVGRDRLLVAYDVVRDTLDVATGELEVALPEARAAAESAPVQADDEAESDIEELEREAATLPEVRVASPPVVTVEPDEPAESDVSADDESDGVADQADDTRVVPASPDDLEGRRSSSVKVIRQQPLVDDEAETEVVTSATEEAVEEPAAEPLVTPAEEPSAKVVEPPVTIEVDEPGELPPPPAEVAGEASVSMLFAQIRSEAEVASEPDELDDASSPVEVVEVVEVIEVIEIVEEFEIVEELVVDAVGSGPGEKPNALVATDPDHGLIVRRDEALVAVERALSRRIKRELSDEQNELLDTVRRQRGGPSADQALPPTDVHVARYVEAALPNLAAAAAAGGDLVATGGRSAKSGKATKTKTADLARELAKDLIEPLRERVERCFIEAAGDEEDLAERLRACYREWKGQRVDDVAARYALAACNRGFVDRLPKATLVHWVVNDGSTPSPDCDDNALAGNQPKGEPFPTGHATPPISATCRCMVVPAST